MGNPLADWDHDCKILERSARELVLASHCLSNVRIYTRHNRMGPGHGSKKRRQTTHIDYSWCPRHNCTHIHFVTSKTWFFWSKTWFENTLPHTKTQFNEFFILIHVKRVVFVYIHSGVGHLCATKRKNCMAKVLGDIPSTVRVHIDCSNYSKYIWRDCKSKFN